MHIQRVGVGIATNLVGLVDGSRLHHIERVAEVAVVTTAVHPLFKLEPHAGIVRLVLWVDVGGIECLGIRFFVILPVVGHAHVAARESRVGVVVVRPLILGGNVGVDAESCLRAAEIVVGRVGVETVGGPVVRLLGDVPLNLIGDHFLVVVGGGRNTIHIVASGSQVWELHAPCHRALCQFRILVGIHIVVDKGECGGSEGAAHAVFNGDGAERGGLVDGDGSRVASAMGGGWRGAVGGVVDDCPCGGARYADRGGLQEFTAVGREYGRGHGNGLAGNHDVEHLRVEEVMALRASVHIDFDTHAHGVAKVAAHKPHRINVGEGVGGAVLEGDGNRLLCSSGKGGCQDANG